MLAALQSALLATGPSLLLIHDFHEGSHAICEAFANECPPADCTEDYDGYHHHSGVAAWDAIRALSGVLLVRLKPSEVRFLPPQAVCVVLVRTDLMRWTVSSYLKMYGELAKRVGVEADPQFFNESALSAANLTSRAVFMHMARVNRAAEGLLHRWVVKVELLERLLAANRTAYVITYEQFLEGGALYVQKILRRARVACPQADNASLDGGVASRAGWGQQVHRAHGNMISDYAQNYDEIVRHFAITPFPRWANLAQNYSQLHI